VDVYERQKMKKLINISATIVLNLMLPGLGLLFQKRFVSGAIFTFASTFLMLALIFSVVFPNIIIQQFVQILFVLLLIISTVMIFDFKKAQKSRYDRYFFLIYFLSAICFYAVSIWQSRLSFDLQDVRDYGPLCIFTYRNTYQVKFMEPGIIPGDMIYLANLQSGDSLYRGDIVGVKPEIESKYQNLRYPEYVLGRIIGLPGERIYIKNGFVFINDKLLYEPWIDLKLDRYISSKKHSKFEEINDLKLENDEYYILADDRLSMGLNWYGITKRKLIETRVKYLQSTLLSYIYRNPYRNIYTMSFGVREVDNTRWFLYDPAILQPDSLEFSSDSTKDEVEVKE